MSHNIGIEFILEPYVGKTGLQNVLCFLLLSEGCKNSMTFGQAQNDLELSKYNKRMKNSRVFTTFRETQPAVILDLVCLCSVV